MEEKSRSVKKRKKKVVSEIQPINEDVIGILNIKKERIRSSKKTLQPSE